MIEAISADDFLKADIRWEPAAVPDLNTPVGVWYCPTEDCSVYTVQIHHKLLDDDIAAPTEWRCPVCQNVLRFRHWLQELIQTTEIQRAVLLYLQRRGLLPWSDPEHNVFKIGQHRVSVYSNELKITRDNDNWEQHFDYADPEFFAKAVVTLRDLQ